MNSRISNDVAKEFDSVHLQLHFFFVQLTVEFFALLESIFTDIVSLDPHTCILYCVWVTPRRSSMMFFIKIILHTCHRKMISRLTIYIVKVL